MSGDDLPGTLPDLADPATLGCLLALVRDAWNDPDLVTRKSPQYDERGWTVESSRGFVSIGQTAEAAALVAALEAAP